MFFRTHKLEEVLGSIPSEALFCSFTSLSFLSFSAISHVYYPKIKLFYLQQALGTIFCPLCTNSHRFNGLVVMISVSHWDLLKLVFGSQKVSSSILDWTIFAPRCLPSDICQSFNFLALSLLPFKWRKTNLALKMIPSTSHLRRMSDFRLYLDLVGPWDDYYKMIALNNSTDTTTTGKLRYRLRK